MHYSGCGYGTAESVVDDSAGHGRAGRFLSAKTAILAEI